MAQSILAPFVAKMTRLPAFLGVGLAWTLVAARRAGVVGLSIRGLGAWLSATVVVWLVTAAATVC